MSNTKRFDFHIKIKILTPQHVKKNKVEYSEGYSDKTSNRFTYLFQYKIIYRQYTFEEIINKHKAFQFTF